MLAPVYCGIRKPMDFDPALKAIELHTRSGTVCIGSASCSNASGFQVCKPSSVNVDNPDFEQAQKDAWNGAYQNGWRPIAHYLIHSVFAAAGAVIFFGVVGVLRQHKIRIPPQNAVK